MSDSRQENPSLAPQASRLRPPLGLGPGYLFRCDGSPRIGLGHIVRCLTLADELSQLHDCRIAFAVREGAVAFEMIEQKGYRVIGPPREGKSFYYFSWLAEAISEIEADQLILDVRDDLPVLALDSLREAGILVVTLDDPSERRLFVDMAFYPPAPQLKGMDWSGFTGRLYSGWEWVVLRPQFSAGPTRSENREPLVLVTMGGSDPAGLTLLALKALLLEPPASFTVAVVLGRAFAHDRELEDLVAEFPHPVTVHRDLSDVACLMAQADLAVASFGLTAYELAAMHVPSIFLCLTEDHALSARAFASAGIGIDLGVYESVSTEQLARSIRFLLDDREQRRRMSEMAAKYVDGLGAVRIGQILASSKKKSGKLTWRDVGRSRQ